ncbi:MAG: hypothetical protein IKO57_06500 [Treponema sp.]|nr:hypothetical protein [Treponema sp.]
MSGLFKTYWNNGVQHGLSQGISQGRAEVINLKAKLLLGSDFPFRFLC